MHIGKLGVFRGDGTLARTGAKYDVRVDGDTGGHARCTQVGAGMRG
jgi:hypothetical protein